MTSTSIVHFLEKFSTNFNLISGKEFYSMSQPDPPLNRTFRRILAAIAALIVILVILLFIRAYLG